MKHRTLNAYFNYPPKCSNLPQMKYRSLKGGGIFLNLQLASTVICEQYLLSRAWKVEQQRILLLIWLAPRLSPINPALKRDVLIIILTCCSVETL